VSDSPPDVRILPITPQDLPRAAELFHALHTFNATFDPRFTLADDWPTHLRAAYERTRDDPDTLWTLAWHGEEAVGLLLAQAHLDPPIFRHRRWLELSALYVEPSYRRHGVARLLVEYLQAWARQRGFDAIQLYVSAANTGARQFYARQGFELLQEIWRYRL